MKNYKTCGSFLIAIILVVLHSCKNSETDYKNFFLHTVDDNFSIQIPNYLEEQDYEISSRTLQYGEDLLNRINYQQKGTNEKFRKDGRIIPIQNSLDINLIKGSSNTFNIISIQELTRDQLEKREDALFRMVKSQVVAKQTNVNIEKVGGLEVQKTENSTYYFKESFKVNGNPVTFIIIPLKEHMLNISFSCQESNNNDFTKSINSIIINENL